MRLLRSSGLVGKYLRCSNSPTLQVLFTVSRYSSLSSTSGFIIDLPINKHEPLYQPKVSLRYIHSTASWHNLDMMPHQTSRPILPIPPKIELSYSFTMKTSTPKTSSNDAKKLENVKEEKKTEVTSASSEKSIEPKKPKKSLWARIKNEMIHYYHGFRLLGLETKIAGGICIQLLMGKTLSRRERNQLVRTAADIFRLVPFAVFIIVPFMEFLLPLYLKFFPFMLPSTFKEQGKEEEKMRRVLKAKLEMARFLQETVMKTNIAAKKDKNMPTIMEFQEFMKLVRQSGQLASVTDIVRFSHLFEDQVTLDSLEHGQLKALCQLLEVPAIGPSNLLRFQLWLRVRQLRAEDILLAKEGIDQIPSWELQALSRSRGMRSLGLTECRLRSQLAQWLDLHLEKNVPISLLLLSRAMYLQDTTLPPEQQLQEVISKLPISASDEAAIKAIESTSDIDPKTKMQILRQEQKSIEAERAAVKQRKSEEKKMELNKQAVQIPAPNTAETLLDAAQTGKSFPGEELIDKAPVQLETSGEEKFTPPKEIVTLGVDLKEELVHLASEAASSRLDHPEEHLISLGDLDKITSAIGNLSEPNKALRDEELIGLQVEVAQTAKLRHDHQRIKQGEIEDAAKSTLVSPTLPESDISDEPVSKSALAAEAKAKKMVKRIGDQVDRLLSEMNSIIGQLDKRKLDLLKDIKTMEDKASVLTKDDEKERLIQSIRADQQCVVDITDVVDSLQKLQKGEPDFERWQLILDSLDEDHDGKIELKHVVSLVKLFHGENLTVNTKQIADVMDMLEQEEMVQETVETSKIKTPATNEKLAEPSTPSSGHSK